MAFSSTLTGRRAAGVPWRILPDRTAGIACHLHRIRAGGGADHDRRGPSLRARRDDPPDENSDLLGCGWLKDKFGVTWQVTPRILDELLAGPDRAGADRVMQTLSKMVKLD